MARREWYRGVPTDIILVKNMPVIYTESTTEELVVIASPDLPCKAAIVQWNNGKRVLVIEGASGSIIVGGVTINAGAIHGAVDSQVLEQVVEIQMPPHWKPEICIDTTT